MKIILVVLKTSNLKILRKQLFKSIILLKWNIINYEMKQIQKRIPNILFLNTKIQKKKKQKLWNFFWISP